MGIVRFSRVLTKNELIIGERTLGIDPKFILPRTSRTRISKIWPQPKVFSSLI